jgi:hypothetical protein
MATHGSAKAAFTGSIPAPATRFRNSLKIKENVRLGSLEMSRVRIKVRMN